MDEVELTPLFGQGGVLVADIFDELIDGGDLRVDADALVKTRQEGRLPIGTAAGRRAAWPQRYVSRHVLIFRAQSVEDPRTYTGSGHSSRTGVHENRGDFVGRNVGVHRANDGQIID